MCGIEPHPFMCEETKKTWVENGGGLQGGPKALALDDFLREEAADSLTHGIPPLQAIAVSLFGINGCLQLSSTMFQRLPKKRQLNSLVLFINFVPLVTYTCSLMEIFPKFRTPDGLPLEYLHITQWMFTTPTMIIIVSSLGTSMRKSLVFNWKMTLRCIMWDEITLINGLIMFLVPPPFHWIPLFFAICSYCKTLIAIHKIVHYACKNAGTSFEVNSIKTLEVLPPNQSPAAPPPAAIPPILPKYELGPIISKRGEGSG